MCDLVATDGQFTNADVWCMEHDSPASGTSDQCDAARAATFHNFGVTR